MMREMSWAGKTGACSCSNPHRFRFALRLVGLRRKATVIAAPARILSETDAADGSDNGGSWPKAA
jgi:hypothetical protein